MKKRLRVDGQPALIPDVYNIKKPKHNEKFDHIDDSHDLAEVPSDTLVVIQQIRNSFPPDIDNTPPIVLKSQLYFSLHDRTVVEKELSMLQQSGTIQLFSMPSNNPNDLFIVLTNDIKSFIDDLIAKETLESRRRNLQTFSRKIVGKYFETFITRDSLIQEMIVQSIDNDDDDATETNSIKKQAAEIEKDLIQIGFLTRRDASSFSFSLPNFGRIVRSILKGREFIIKKLKRTKNHEMMMDELLQCKCKQSEFPISLLLKDSVGTGAVQKVSIPSGSLIRLSK